MINAHEWNSGRLTEIPVPDSDLKDLNVKSGGIPLWTSNNPEKFTSDGWLMLNSRKSCRGGKYYPLSGKFRLYLYHCNGTGTDKFIHVFATNPNDRQVDLSFTGSVHTSKTTPFDEVNGQGGGREKGPSYKVAEEWLKGEINRSLTKRTLLGRGHVADIETFKLSPNELFEARFEVNTNPNDGILIYSTITSDGQLSTALNLSQIEGEEVNGEFQKGPANGKRIPTRIDGNSIEFGRSAGICKSSAWRGMTELEIPEKYAYIGLCLNTYSPQMQVEEYLMKLQDSADKSFGNYGHEYNVELKLINKSTTEIRRVKLSFAHRDINFTCQPFSYSGPIRVGDKLKSIYTTKEKPQEVLLEEVVIPPNSSTSVRLELVIPGSIFIGQQLILESL